MQERTPDNLTRSPVRMGQFAVAMNGDVLQTLLGSCLGLALYDGRHRVGGLAHVVLPQSRGNSDPPGKFVDTAIPALLEEMKAIAGRAIEPTARIAGGANMFSTNLVKTVGRQNIEATEQLLEEFGIPIVGRDCGGEKGRRMALDTNTGLITIEVVGAEPIELPDLTHCRRTRHGQARTHR